jgi:hypothetical protein
MNTNLNDQLVALHHRVAALKVYDIEAGQKLSTCSHEFGKILSELMSLDADAFKEINQAYVQDTATNCDMAANSSSEDDRSEAFYYGVGNLNDNINDSLEYFSDSAHTK